MFGLFDFSKIVDSFNLAKMANSIFMTSYTSFKNFIKKAVPNNSIANVLTPPLSFISRKMTPEMSEYASRIALRSLVGLSPLATNTLGANAVKRLSGSVSWISAEKIDVTEVIRELRDC